jgi:hypothetical protein
MQSLNRSLTSTLLTLGATLLLTGPACAQLYGPGSANVSTDAYVGAGNLDANNQIQLYDSSYQGDPAGGAVSVTGSQNFTGMDSQGNPQTMTEQGSAMASADYGILHAYASGSVTNPYYNAANPAYFTGGSNGLNSNGSPQYLWIAGQATYSDAITFYNAPQPIQYVSYVFHLEGNITDAQHAYAFFAFSADDNSTVFFSPANVEGPNIADWATPEWQLNSPDQITFAGNFGAVVGFNTNYYNTPEGQYASGIADFYDTLTLTGIQLLNANGQQINGVNYLTASGAQYNVMGATYGLSAVPEPGSMALLAGLGFGAGILRIKRGAKKRRS